MVTAARQSLGCCKIALDHGLAVSSRTARNSRRLESGYVGQTICAVVHSAWIARGDFRDFRYVCGILVLVHDWHLGRHSSFRSAQPYNRDQAAARFEFGNQSLAFLVVRPAAGPCVGGLGPKRIGSRVASCPAGRCQMMPSERGHGELQGVRTKRL